MGREAGICAILFNGCDWGGIVYLVGDMVYFEGSLKDDK